MLLSGLDKIIKIWEYRPSASSFTLKVYKFFKKGQLQDCLKQLSLEQDPGHSTRQQDKLLQNRLFFYLNSLKAHCTFYPFQQF